MTTTPAETWVAALVTLGMWTWLIDRQNPVFETCSNLYISFSFGYSIALEYTNYLKPALAKIGHGQWILALGILLGLMIYCRYWKPVEFLGRWSVSYFVGYGAGYVLAFTPAVFLGQVNGSFVKLWGNHTLATTVDNWVLLLALLASLMYFFFTVRRDTPVVRAGTGLGRYLIMLGLGALFGSTILFRYSLLFGRVYFVFHNWLHVV
jgi:hypothetical protein